MAEDPWRYWAVTHATLDIMNPLSSRRLDEVVERMALPRGARVVDFASGKGELLLRLSRRYRVRGTGVDLSPYSVRDARQAAARRAPGAHLRFVEEDGAAFAARARESYDGAFCIGATWIWGGWQGTLEALCRITRPGAVVAVGHPFWRKAPPPAYLKAEGLKRLDFATREADLASARKRGLALAGRFTSTRSEWHHYESSQWRAAAAFAARHPEDPLAPEALARTAKSRRAYFEAGRDCLGWTLWVFCKEK